MASEEKTYICSNYPFLGIGGPGRDRKGIRFERGIFRTSKPGEQRMIENSGYFKTGQIRIQGAPRVVGEAAPHDPMQLVETAPGWYEFQGKKYHGKNNLPPEARALLLADEADRQAIGL